MGRGGGGGRQSRSALKKTCGGGQWAVGKGQGSGAGGGRKFLLSVVKEPKSSERLGGNQKEGMGQGIGVFIL